MTAELHVLLVEDSEPDARLVAEDLHDAEPGAVELTVHETLAGACAHVETQRTDCVLLDLSLPDAFDLQGVDALRELRPDVPIVVLSGATRDGLAVRAVQSGAQDYLLKGETSGPLLLRSIRYAMERKQSERRLTTLAMSDALTGLPNRTLLLERAHAALDEMRRTIDQGAQAPAVGLLFLDLDRFKLVNDSLGHAAGDELLMGVSRRLRTAVRPDDTVARFGGDEFAVLCAELKDPAELDAIAARVAAALAEPMTVAGTEIFPSVSIGKATASGREDSPERLLQEADAGMYRAKAEGRGPGARQDPGTAGGADHALRTESELHHALLREELVVHYQPQVPLSGTGGICRVEALLRWDHPVRGLVGPDEFLDTAKDTGLIGRLGEWVLQESCRQLAAWRAAGLGPTMTLAINLSPRELDDPTLPTRVSAALAAHGLEPECLMFEIDEAALAEAGGVAAQRLEALKALGTKVAIDARLALAWATGALALDHVAVDALKLDRRFVAQMGTDPQARRMVTAVLGMASSLGLQAIAEGIEDEGQARELAALGCELGQGHAFAPASTPSAIAALLAQDDSAEQARIRVFLCDDAEDLRHLLRSFLEWAGDVTIVGEAGDGEGLTAAVRAAAADIVLLDLSMPKVDGLEALADLRADQRDVGIIVLSGFEAHQMEAKALALGADRYLTKASGMEDVRTAVRALAATRRGPKSLLEAA
jgi:diguanylate cyclase (GGDEF)-like protein